jgi:hypothetical protein
VQMAATDGLVAGRCCRCYLLMVLMFYRRLTVCSGTVAAASCQSKILVTEQVLRLAAADGTGFDGRQVLRLLPADGASILTGRRWLKDDGWPCIHAKACGEHRDY